jgi:competence protein ComEC
MSYREIQSAFEKIPGLTQVLHRGDQLGPWQVLHPDDADRFRQADDNAVVLRAQIEGTRILLLSDLGKPGQNALLERGADLRADLVVSGVPAQSEPLADALLDAIQPRVILISDSLYPATARASARLHERMESRNIPVFFTAEAGAITISFPRGEWELRSSKGVIFSSRKSAAAVVNATKGP